MRGLVIKNTGSWYTVLTDDGQLVDCKIKGTFRLKGIRSTNPVAVGDRVTIDLTVPEPAEGLSLSRGAFISEIEDRKNYIIRRSQNLSKQSHIIAANVDQAFLVVTVNYPQTSTTFIDRFLASAEAYRVPVVLIFNKTDRNSGVGKSTLINRLVPDANLRTAEISSSHNLGQHTTTFSEMIPLGGGWAIDTPGIKGFGTFDMAPEELTSYFFSKDCRFSNCTHTHEPGCAVLQALEDHYIAPSRYQSYLSMMEDKDEEKYR